MTGQYPRLMLAGISSGSGKTTISCGILQALLARKVKLHAFKCGPDYIDPLFHTKVIGAPCRNLDLFFTSPDDTRSLFCNAAKDSALSIVEGVMGYYDGLGGVTTEASSYALANALETPVVLIVDAKGLSTSVVALIEGYLHHKKDSRIVGVILNRVSAHVYERLKSLIEDELPIKVYGYLPVMKDCTFESRHLGLVTAQEITSFAEKLSRLAGQVEESIDLEGLIALAHAASPLIWQDIALPAVSQARLRIGVARDEAFCFYYADNLSLLESLGCELVFFSPLHDRVLPEALDGLYLGGGYPELHAKTLSQNAAMRESIAAAIDDNMPCIAECGGFLYLNKTLKDMQGTTYPMAAVLNGNGFYAGRLQRFGYVTLEAQQDNLLCKKGEQMAAHEFHYYDTDQNGQCFVAQKPVFPKRWDCIVAKERLYAGFPHLYFHANRNIAVNFVRAAATYQQEREK